MSSMAEILDALGEIGPRGISRFRASLDASWIEQALQATGTATVRRRKLPAEQVVWLVLGMALFADRSIRNVVDHLGLVLPGVDSLASSAVTAARYRLGAEPMEWLFNAVAGAWAESSGFEDYRGLSLWGIDGSHIRVADSDENFEYFGKPTGRAEDGVAGYPQLRLVWLMNLRNRLLTDVRFGPYSVSERRLAAELWSTIPESSLTIVDRGFVDYATFAALLVRGENRHIMVRVRADMRPVVLKGLPDGTQLVSLRPSWVVKAAHPNIQSEIVGRLITYKHKGGKPSRLFVTLLDHKTHPAQELVDLYHERWELEVGFDELKTHMLERKECLRSLLPEGVKQETWGLLLTYNLVRREMLLAAEAHGLPPQRISFRSSLLWIRTFWLTAWTTPPGNIPRHLGELRSSLDVLILPLRRSERRFPRHVKIKMSNYLRNRGKRGDSAADPGLK